MVGRYGSYGGNSDHSLISQLHSLSFVRRPVEDFSLQKTRRIIIFFLFFLHKVLVFAVPLAASLICLLSIDSPQIVVTSLGTP